MDGLSISTGQKILESGKTVSEIRSDDFKSQATPNADEKSFTQTLKEAITDVNELQQKSDVLTQKLATGETKNIPEVMIAVERADIALKLMTSVRNKIIDAYQEVMKMQV